MGVLVVTVVALSACGDDGAGNEAEPERHEVATTNVREPLPVVAAYESWLAALSARDAARACARHAPEFTIELRQRAILEHRAELGDPCVGFVALLWEDPAREYDPLDIEVTQDTGEDGGARRRLPGHRRDRLDAAPQRRWLVADVTPRSER